MSQLVSEVGWIAQIIGLRLNCVVSESDYKNGDTADVRTPVGQPRENDS
jgi:hypothetical protein